MEIRFANPARRWSLLIGILLVAVILTLLAGQNWLAERWAQSSQPDDWLRATRAEPGNADYWYRLGRYYEFDFEHADLSLAISYYRRAVAIDPRTASYWMDLASAYELVGDTAQARRFFETAKSVYPVSAEVAWRYGNFLLRQEQLPEAFAEIRRAVETDPKLATLAISRCWRASRDIRLILERALPADGGVYLEALNFLSREHEAEAARAVWKRFLALRRSLELPRTFPLLDELVQQDRVEEARQVWQEALHAAGLADPSSSGTSLIWDGGFEGEFIDGGFGWRQKDTAGAAFEFDTETRHSGARSLRVTFDGSANLDFYHVVQFVPVQPRTRYRFAAFLRSEDISTDSGVRFWIVDRRHAADLNILTPNLIGTHAWALADTDFTTGPQTRLVEIGLRRLASRKLDNRIQGTVWVDDVSLTPVSEAAARASP